MALLIVLFGFISIGGHTVIPFWQLASILGGVTLLFLPLTLLFDRHAAQRTRKALGTLRDPQTILETFRRVNRGTDPKSLINDLGEPVGPRAAQT